MLCTCLNIWDTSWIYMSENVRAMPLELIIRSGTKLSVDKSMGMEDEWIGWGYYSSSIHQPGDEWVKLEFLFPFICYVLFLCIEFVKIKQLDFDMSPPANIMSFRLGLIHATLDLDPSDLWPWPWPSTYDIDLQGRPQGHPCSCSDQIGDRNYVKQFPRYEFWLCCTQT